MYKKWYSIFLLIIALIGLTGCQGQVEDINYMNEPKSADEIAVSNYSQADSDTFQTIEESLPLRFTKEGDILSWDCTIFETYMDGSVLSGECSTQTPLHDGGEPLIFRFAFSKDSIDFTSYDVILTILNGDNSTVQTLSYTIYFDNPQDSPISYIALDDSFCDLNFDGYLDLRCLYVKSGYQDYPNYYGWVWDQDANQFTDTNLNEITGALPPVERGSIKGIYRSLSGMADWETSVFQYIDGAFIETNRFEKLAIYDDTSNFYIDDEWGAIPFKEYKLVDNEMVPVWPDNYSSTELGQIEIQEYLFGPDSIWFSQD